MTTPKVSKYQKNLNYRRRCQAKGLCPHCGKPCAPFFECETRREQRAVRRRKPVEQLLRKPNQPRTADHPAHRARGALKRWTPVEDDALLGLIRQSYTLVEMSAYFARTELAVEARARKLAKQMGMRVIRVRPAGQNESQAAGGQPGWDEGAEPPA